MSLLSLVPMLLLACAHTPATDAGATGGVVASSSAASAAALEGLSVQVAGAPFAPAAALLVYAPQVSPDTMKLYLYREKADCARAPVAQVGMVVGGVPRSAGGSAAAGDGVSVQVYSDSGEQLAFSGFSGQATLAALEAGRATVTLALEHSSGSHSVSGTLTASVCELAY